MKMLNPKRLPRHSDVGPRKDTIRGLLFRSG